MLAYVDTGLSHAVTVEKSLLRRDAIRYNVTRYLSPCSFLFRCSQIAAHYELGATKRAQMEYFECLLNEIRIGAAERFLTCQRAVPAILDYMTWLESEEDHQSACRVAVETVGMLRL